MKNAEANLALSDVHRDFLSLSKLKIAVLGKFDNESLGSHVTSTFRESGHDVKTIQVGGVYRHFRWSWLRKIDGAKIQLMEMAQRRLKVSRSIQSAMKRSDLAGVDLAIVTNDVLMPAEVELVAKTLGCPVVMWFPDAVVNMGRTMFLNSPYHTVFIKDRFITDRLKQDFPRRRFEYLPECCNPSVHRPVEPTAEAIEKFGCDITTAGNCYANRVAFFEQLVPENLKIKIWGNLPSAWMNVESIRPMLQREYVVGDAKCHAFRCAKVVLNNLHPGEIDSLNCRAFEIPACKGVQFVNHRDCISELFAIDKEIVTFHNFGELRDKLQHYLGSPALRDEVAEAGYKRVQAEHTYQHRLKQIIQSVLGL